MPRADNGDQRMPQSSRSADASGRSSGGTSSQHAASNADPAMSVILCTGGYDNTIRFWEAWSGICSRTIQHPESVSDPVDSAEDMLSLLCRIQQVNRLAISPDKRYIAAAGNQVIKLYDMHQPPQQGGNVPAVRHCPLFATLHISELAGHHRSHH